MFAAARSSCGTAMLRQMRSFAFLSLSAAFRPVSLFMTLGRARPYVCEKGVLGSGNRFSDAVSGLLRMAPLWVAVASAASSQSCRPARLRASAYPLR